jgi:hypothetical protein
MGVSLIYIQKGVRKMDIQEIKKEKQKIEENFRKILIDGLVKSPDLSP